MARKDGSKRHIIQIGVRVAADMVMVSAALLIALILRYLWLFGVEGSAISPQEAFHNYAQTYLGTFWVLAGISLFVFYGSGFYTRGRFYQGRYKLLVIFQAASLSSLVFSLLLFFLREFISFPRSALPMTWLLMLTFLFTVRLWPQMWRVFARVENRLLSGSADNGKKKVLVIGGAGYIGSALVRRLLDMDYRVRVLDLLLYGDAPVRELYEHPNFELVQGDFRHVDTVVSAVKGMDAIVHLGAIVGDSACSIDEDLTIEINLRATQTIAEVGRGFGIERFVFASTCSVYGASDDVLDERSCLCPISLYARTKVESEKALLNLTDAHFAPTILRFGTVYGLSGRPRFDLVVNLLAAKAVQDGEVGIFGGQQWRPLVHVKDVAEAIALTLQAPLHSVRGQVFNVGSDEQNYQIADLGPLIKEMIPTARVVVQPQEDNRNYRVQFDKIRNVLNFQPRYTVRDGVQEIISAFATGQIVDYRDPCCSNFSFLNQTNRLHPLFVDDSNGWDWVKLSTTDATMLTEVVMAVVESPRQELKDRLRKSIAQAILGDVDGFINTLTDMQVTPVAQAQSASVPEPQPEMPHFQRQEMPAAKPMPA